MKKLILVAAFAALACLMSGPAPFNKVAADNERGHTKFFFAVTSNDKSNGHVIILSGAGTFSRHHVEGGGGFTTFNPVGMPPFPIVNHGTYRATRFVSFTETPGSPYGEQISGVLHMEVELRPVAGPRSRATMKVVCNVPAGALFTGEDEGVTLALHNGHTFEPSGTGVTLFNPARD